MKCLFKCRRKKGAGDALGLAHCITETGETSLQGVRAKQAYKRDSPTMLKTEPFQLGPLTIACNSICSVLRLQCAIGSLLWECSWPRSEFFGYQMQSLFEVSVRSTTEGQSNEKLGEGGKQTFLQENVSHLFSKHVKDVQPHQIKVIEIKSIIGCHFIPTRIGTIKEREITMSKNVHNQSPMHC